MIASMILEGAVAAILDKLIGNAAEDLQAKLAQDPSREALKQSIGNALKRYAVGARFTLARPFMKQDSLLSNPAVSREFAAVLRFDHDPDTQLIGERWKQALDRPPQWRNFAREARILLDYFENELKNTEVFRPVFQLKSLDAIETNTSAAAESLGNIEAQLDSLIDLIDARFGDLSERFLQGSVSIQDDIRDYSRFIEEKTREFVGRDFVFDAIEQFINNNPRGYFFVRGDPGIGKSAIAAQLVKTKGYFHHFNIRYEGVNKATDFMKNICAQLIAAYDLNYAKLPPEATQNGSFLADLLHDISQRLNGEQCVIVVDALDEVDNTGLSAGANILYLPRVLPEGVYIVTTARREQFPLRLDIPEQESLFIEQDDAGNVADVRTYVEKQISNDGIQDYIESHEIDDELFTEHLVEKSQGNFIYLRMVLPEIEKGAYTDLDLSDIPAGLYSYYEDHWRRMRQQDELNWFDYKLPVIVALTVVKEPVSLDLIIDFSYVDDRRRTRAVLRDFDQFLYRTSVEYEGGTQTRYRWYHASFFEFIAAKEDIADERVDLVEANRKIADRLWKDAGLDQILGN